MKKLFGFMLLCATLVLSVSSCSKDDGDDSVLTSTYTVIYSAVEPADGIDLNIIVFEYNDKDEVIHQNPIKNAYMGLTSQFTAKPNAQKLKVYLEMRAGDLSSASWVQQIYYLEPGKNIEIDITDDIRVGKVEP